MKKTGAILATAILLLVVAALAAEKNMGAPILVIPGGKKPPVTLPHEAHQAALQEDCNSCHNLFPQVAGSIEKLKEEGALKKMQVMKQCQGCHKDFVKAGKKAGPVKCDECHKE